MRAHPDIVEIVAGDCEQCLRRSAPRPPTPAPGQSSCGAWIEELALGDERPEDLRARLEAARAAYRPDSPTAEALVLQATLSQLEVQRCHKIRASLRAEKVRTAVKRFDEEQDDEIGRIQDEWQARPRASVIAMQRTAAGVRYLIARWERLGRRLEEDGTWYGKDRLEAIGLRGYSPKLSQLYFYEEAYWIWVKSLAAEPDPKPRDIDIILESFQIPKRLYDKGVQVWPLDPDESRAFLQSLVEEQLAYLRPLEEELRVTYEEPARAAAVERALARKDADDDSVLRALRGHERSLERAHEALTKRKGRPR